MHAYDIICCFQNGFIKSKAIPNLVLAVLDFTITTNIAHPTKGPTSTSVEGFLVGFEKKQGHDPSPNQCWEFTNDGYMRAQSNPDLVLTYLGAEYANNTTEVTNQEENPTTTSGQGLYLCVADKIEGGQSKAQR